jgi:hypothetical protein
MNVRLFPILHTRSRKPIGLYSPRAMKTEYGRSTSSMGQLPTELCREILDSMSDIRSLASASVALSCRAFYLAFKEYWYQLVQEVLINCVGIGALADALITHDCSPPILSRFVQQQDLPLASIQERELQNCVSRFLASTKPLDIHDARLSLNEALSLGDFHLNVVSVLVQRFIQACTKKAKWQKPLDKSLQSRPASLAEKARIARVLYRFETFRRLFGCIGNSVNVMDYTAMFLTKYSPWENIKLSSFMISSPKRWHQVCASLINLRGIIFLIIFHTSFLAFNEIAERDIVGGEHSINFRVDADDGAIQHLLTLGPSSIPEIATCDTYTDSDAQRAVKSVRGLELTWLAIWPAKLTKLFWLS